VVGTPVADRGRAETEDLIGFFVNTLVLRADLSGEPSFTALLGRVRAMGRQAYAHEDLPVGQLVDELVTDRDRSRTPLFQVLLNYVTATGDGGDGRGRRRSDGDGGSDGGPVAEVIAKFDLRLIVAENGAGLAGAAEYSTALFDAATIGRMTGHLGVLLAAIAADPAAPLSRLPVLTGGEREQLLAGWNDTAAPVPAAGGVHELITARAAACPDAVAVASGHACLTYRGLTERSARLAGYLRGAGVGTETVVGLCLEPGPDMIVAMLAVWRAGGTYLPLDPDYPPGRLAFMLTSSRASVVVGTSAAVENLPIGRLRIITLDDPATRAALAEVIPSAQSEAVHPAQLAYVIYTSGSTGTPKGVEVTHGGLINYVTWVPDRTGFGDPGARYGLLQPIVTDFGNTMILTSLVTGGVLHIVDAGAVVDPASVARYVRARGIDYLKAVPSHLVALAAADGLDGLLPARTLLLGGEGSPAEWIGDVLAAAGSRGVVNHYGPTETTIGAVTARLSSHHLAGGTVPIGSPVANTSVYVLDAQLNPVPVGVVGELFIGGAQLARGYGRQAAMTAERFIADRIAADGSRIYRTGDRVRRRPDGLLEFLGRADRQLKIRGYRIEPGELEAALAAHPRVRSVVVSAHESDSGRLLAAYLVAAEPAEGLPAVGELRDYLRDRVPEFMIPSLFTELAALPLTPTGKLDHAALPSPEGAQLRSASGYTEPSTPTEVRLARVWAAILNQDRIGIHDNFFDLGGHSLLAIQMISRIREVCGVDIPIATVFDKPTIVELAVAINKSILGMDDDSGEYEEFEF